LTQFKETNFKGIWPPSVWKYYGEPHYNLVTDHIECLRIWPRSVVNGVGTDGNLYQVDGRLKDEDLEGKTGRYKVFLDSDTGFYQPDKPVAYLDEIGLVEEGAIVTGGVRHPVGFPSKLVDAAVYSGTDNSIIGIMEDGRVVVADSSGVRQTYTWTVPPDEVHLSGSKIVVGPRRTYTVNPDGLEYFGANHVAVIDNGGSILIGDMGANQIEVRHRITIPLSGQGICHETPGTTLKEGPDFAYGFLVGEGRGQIAALNCYPANFGAGDFSVPVNLPGYNNQGAAFSPTGMFYKEGGRALAIHPIGREMVFGLPIPEDLSSYRFERSDLEHTDDGARVHALWLSTRSAPFDPDRPTAIDKCDLIHLTWQIPKLGEFRKMAPVTIPTFTEPGVVIGPPDKKKFQLPLTLDLTYRKPSTGATAQTYHQYLEHVQPMFGSTIGRTGSGSMRFLISAVYPCDYSEDGEDVVVVYWDDEDIGEHFPYSGMGILEEMAWVTQGTLTVATGRSGIRLDRKLSLQDRLDDRLIRPIVNPQVSGSPLRPMPGKTFYTEQVAKITLETRANQDDFWMVLNRGAWPLEGVHTGIAFNGLGS
jgi:hypothetical protein